MKKVAVITGNKGKLGIIWTDVLRGNGYETYGIDLPSCDIKDKGNLNYIAELLNDCGQTPDIIINNAGIDNPPDTKSTFFGNCKEIIDVNLIGAVNVCETFIPYMKEKGGVIINIGSIYGQRTPDPRIYPEGFEKPLGYSLSKAGLLQLSRSITVQYAKYGIRSVTLTLAGVASDSHTEEFKKKYLAKVPMGRFVSRESLENALLFACRTPELAGVEIIVDGGYTSW